jgi:F0F1-type ATP synthase membrane subunit b/b'
MIAGIAALVILIAVIFIFGGDLIKPMVELNQRNAQVTDSIAEIARSLDNTAKILAGVIQERQYITADTGGTVALLNRTAPN